MVPIRHCWSITCLSDFIVTRGNFITLFNIIRLCLKSFSPIIVARTAHWDVIKTLIVPHPKEGPVRGPLLIVDLEDGLRDRRRIIIP